MSNNKSRTSTEEFALVPTVSQPLPRKRRNRDSEVTIPESSGTPSPTNLWNRANMVRHLKLAADVRVVVQSLNTTVSIKRSELIAQVQRAPEDAVFLAPRTEVSDEVGLVLVFV